MNFIRKLTNGKFAQWPFLIFTSYSLKDITETQNIVLAILKLALST